MGNNSATQNFKKSPYFPYVLGFLLISLPYLIFLFPQETWEYLTDEDKLFEALGSLCFLAAAVFMFICFFKSKEADRSWWQKWAFPYLLLGLLFFMAFGEEISWGQRIFGWETPEALEEINMQDEFNIHNLKWFQPGEHREGISKFLTAKWLFTFFGFGYFFLTPLLYAKWAFFKNLSDLVRLPIPPIWLGILFLFNIPFSEGVEYYLNSRPGVTPEIEYEITHSVAELMEFVWAVLIGTLGWHFWKEQKKALG